MKEPSQLKLAVNFFSQFALRPIDSTSYMLTSIGSSMLVRTHIINEDDQQTLQEVTCILDQQLSYDHQYIAPLLYFEKCQQGVRAFYEVDALNLRDQVEKRSREEKLFSEQQLWVLLSSVVDSLIYLQTKGTIYGVLSSSKIFVSKQIRLMNPFAYTLAPVNISRISFHSPQIAVSDTSIDFNQSDVYLLGLCLLEAATLHIIDNKIGKEDIKKLHEKVKQSYSSQMAHVLHHMLKQQAQERPSFKDIQQYMEAQIQIKTKKTWPSELLPADCQDIPVEISIINGSPEKQLPDYLQSQIISRRKQSQYQRARGQFLDSPHPLKDRKNLPATTHQSKESKKSTVQQEKFRKYTEQRSVEPIQQFRIAVIQTVNKNLRKKPRAVQIKNRNAEEVRKIETFLFQVKKDFLSTEKNSSKFKVSEHSPIY